VHPDLLVLELALVRLTLQANITVRNGTIQSMGFAGIFLQGDGHLVENIHARSNGKAGIAISQGADKEGSIVQNNTAQRNGHFGIGVDRGLVSHNVADVNGTGISLGDGSAAYTSQPVIRILVCYSGERPSSAM
jgi:hypothetical protein